jgi:hypothetical protein
MHLLHLENPNQLAVFKKGAKPRCQRNAKARDDCKGNYLKGVASYALTFITNWMILREEDPDKRKEEHEKISKHAEDAIHYLQLGSQDFLIAETILFYAETYSSLACDHSESKLQERHSWPVQEKKEKRGLDVLRVC